MINKILLSFGIGLMTGGFAHAQSDKLTLEECYRLARENYPAVRKMELVDKTASYTIKNANKKFLPQLNITGQATYQSQVVDYGDLLGDKAAAMGLTPPTLSKDQYRILGEVDQLLFDGGGTRYHNKITQASADLQKQNIEVALYAINERINNIFFSIFLMDAQLQLNRLKLANLQTQLNKAEAAYKYGTAYASSVNEIKAEIENTKSGNIDAEGNRSAYLKMLSIFIGRELSGSSELIEPKTELISSTINRPELRAFDMQKSMIEAQKKLLHASLLPTLSLFIQGAYGRPTLNPISNRFGSWYMAGLRLHWSIGSLYTSKNQRSIYDLNREIADTDKSTFIRNVEIDIEKQHEDIKKYMEMIEQDHKTIALREEVTKSAMAQLDNGVITTHEYIQKLNNENAAKQNLVLHRILLLQARYNMKFKTGN